MIVDSLDRRADLISEEDVPLAMTNDNPAGARRLVAGAPVAPELTRLRVATLLLHNVQWPRRQARDDPRVEAVRSFLIARRRRAVCGPEIRRQSVLFRRSRAWRRDPARCGCKMRTPGGVKSGRSGIGRAGFVVKTTSGSASIVFPQLGSCSWWLATRFRMPQR